MHPVTPGRPIRRRGQPAGARLIAGICAAALLLPTLAPLPLRAQNTLPALGDPASADLEIGTERKLGERIMREIRTDPDYLDDPVLLDYLQSLWQPLLAQARLRGNIGADVSDRLAWEPFLVRDRSVNAFALPGGYVGMHLGMMAVTASRDELASVLAHEMSHVSQRHIARSVANSSRQSLIGLAALLVGVLVASRSGGGDAAQAAITGGQALAVQGMLNFSRDMEREADRVGLAVMAGAGFDAGGMASMFEKLDLSTRLNDSGGFPYLRSHPLTTERIGEARARLGAEVPTAANRSAAMAAAAAGALEHSTAQARARVLMDPRSDALRRWQAQDADRGGVVVATTVGLPDRLAGAYASALASTLLRDWARADASITNAASLLQQGGGAGGSRDRAMEARAERAVGLLKVESLLARGDVARAALALQPYAGDGSRPVVLLKGQAALAQAQTPAPVPGPAGGVDVGALLDRAAGELQTWVALHPQDALAWGLLGQVWGRLGQPLRAIRAEAESRLALGDLVGALDRLRAGQRRGQGGGGAVDFIDMSVIDSRLRAIEAQRKLLVAEEEKGER